MILLIFSNIIVVLSAVLLVRNFFSTKGLADKILLCFLLFFAQIIIVELVFGILGRFYFREILLSHCVILLLLAVFLPKKDVFSFRKPEIEFIFYDKILLLAISVFSCFFIVKAYINLINPPTCVDSLQFHLACPAFWVRNGNIITPFYLFSALKGGIELSFPTYQPINAHFFFAWLMLPLKNAFLADLGEAPFYLIGILAVYSILKKFSVDRNTALFSGLLWALIPNIFKQLKYGSQIDIVCSVLFLLVFNNLMLLKREINLKNALIFGISLGMLVGTKLLTIIYASALLPICIYYFLRIRKTISVKKIIVSILAIVIPVFVFGGYTYLKNYIHSGNPFFPIQIKIFNHLLFPGLMDNITISKMFLVGYGRGLYDLLFREGLGVQFIAYILPGTFLPLILFKLIKNKAKPIGEYLLFFTIPILMLFFYYFFIHATTTRYIFVYLGMGLITAVVFFDKFSWGRKYVTIFGLIAVIASASELAHGFELVISLISSLVLYVILLITKRRVLNLYGRINRFKFIIIILILSAALYFLNEKYNKEEFSRYPSIYSKKESWQRNISFGWQWINENSGKGSRIVYAGRSEIYPLFGSKLKNDVLYISVNKRPLALYDLAVGHYRREKDFQAWVDNLDKLKVDFLFIALPVKINNESDNPNDFPVEDQWALSHPELFSRVFNNSLVHIYKVLGK